MIALAAASFALYYFEAQTAASPTWQHVAAGSMGLVSVLAGMGYRDFQKRMRDIKSEMQAFHLAHSRALIDLCEVVQCADTEKLHQIRLRLISPSAPEEDS
jgi:hypothetical protein